MITKINQIRILPLLISVIFLFGLFATTKLAYTDFTLGNVCPKLFEIPACYIILLCFLIPFISHIFKFTYPYFIGTGIALIIAVYGSVMEFLNILSCPKTESNIPMCYISFSIFLSLILLKKFQMKISKT